MKSYHVVAMSKNRVIGKDNQLPWHFSADLKHFKALTSGSTVIMGRKTFESIGRPLPNRENYILSRSQLESTEALHYFQSIEEALSAVKTEKAFIIGGANIYEQTIGNVSGIYLTKIDEEYEGDAYYPEIPEEFVLQDKKMIQEDPRIEVIYYERQGHE